MKRVFLMAALTVGLLGTSVLAADKKDEKKDKKAYPLKTCVVSDEKLGDMGKPFVFEHKGREIQLCCESCKKDFNKSPDKFLKKLDEAEKKEKK